MNWLLEFIAAAGVTFTSFTQFYVFDGSFEFKRLTKLSENIVKYSQLEFLEYNVLK